MTNFTADAKAGIEGRRIALGMLYEYDEDERKVLFGTEYIFKSDKPLQLTYTCPVCEREINGNTTVYRHASGEIVGCEMCVKEVEAREMENDDG